MPLLTWLLIVGILILAVITRTIIFLHTSRRERFHFRPFEIGSEREEFLYRETRKAAMKILIKTSLP